MNATLVDHGYYAVCPYHNNKRHGRQELFSRDGGLCTRTTWHNGEVRLYERWGEGGDGGLLERTAATSGYRYAYYESGMPRESIWFSPQTHKIMMRKLYDKQGVEMDRRFH